MKRRPEIMRIILIMDLNTREKYRELRRKYGTGSIIMLSVDFLELSMMLDAMKLAEEHPDMIEFNLDYEKHIDRLKNRIIAATGQLGLSVDEIGLLRAEFMEKNDRTQISRSSPEIQR